MRIAIVISTLPQRTTNQLVGLSIAEELEKNGHSVDLYCIGRVTHEELEKAYHKQIKGRIFSRKWLWTPGATIYDYPILATLLGGYSGYDLVFEAIGPVVHLSRARVPQLTYVFFPPDPDLMGDGKFRSGFWRLYSVPYRIFYRSFSRNVHLTRILSLSEYCADLCKRAWEMDSQVVYFPVPYAAWVPTVEHLRDGVITLGRFSPEKNQLEQVAIAEALRRAEVTAPMSIVGAVASAPNRALYLHLAAELVKRGISKVTLYPNLPTEKVVSLAQTSKVFLHTMRYEHFGIATVEAIAAGCVPIVHDSGGSREIVPVEELRFRTTEEAAEKVERALQGEYDRHLPMLREYISRFSEDSFKARVTEIILSAANERRKRQLVVSTGLRGKGGPCSVRMAGRGLTWRRL